MSNPNLKPSLRAPVLAAIASASQSVGTAVPANGVDMGAHIGLMCAVSVGSFGSGATATAHWEQATETDFSDAKAIVGRDPVDLAEDLPAQLNLKANELDTNNGFRYVRPVITIGTAAVHAGALVMAFDSKDQPAEPLTGTVVD